MHFAWVLVAGLFIVDFGLAAATKQQRENNYPHKDEFNASIEWAWLNMVDSKDLALIKSKAMEYCRTHFLRMTESDAILNLNQEDFIKLLSSNDLNLSTEEPMFDVAIRWLQHEPTNRTALQWQILKNIRFGLLSSEFLATRVQNNTIVQNAIQVRELVNQTINNRISPIKQKQSNGCQEWPRNGTQHVFVFDYNTSAMSIIKKKKKQSQQVKIPNDPKDFAAVVYECHIYVFGGNNSGNYTRKVHMYNAMTNTWTQSVPMRETRFYPSAVTMNNLIYVTGGYNGVDFLSSAEYFNPDTNTWLPMAPMLTPRYSHTLVVFQNNLYALGGQDEYFHSLNTVERFDALRNIWTWTTPMLVKRSSMGAVELNGKLYACGGIDVNSNGELSSAEVFDPVEQTWQPIERMNIPRSEFSLLAYEDKLYAVGGAHLFPTSIDIYDTESNTWRLVNYLDYNLIGLTLPLNL